MLVRDLVIPFQVCDRLGAACDFRIVGLESDRLVEWILEQPLPFDSLYYYGSDSRSETLREHATL